MLAARAGDTIAFTKIHDKYYEDLLRLAITVTRNSADAQDLVQECFVGLWKNLHQIEQTENLGPYLYVALRNRAFSLFRREKGKAERLLEAPFEPVASEEMIYSRIRTKEVRACIAEAVTLLPGRAREIFLLSREQHLSIADIAEQLGLSTQTVKNQISIATQRIREHLKKNNLNFWWLML
jgi:RNA polymerase sigma-70 factor (ECF subfamily)